MPSDAGPTPFSDLEERIGLEVRKRFPRAERIEAYGMRGWRVKRPREVEWTHGTIDPNWLCVFLGDRKQGPTLHLWNPFDPKTLDRNRRELEAAGFNVMVGCLQFARKRPYPVEAVARLLDQAKERMDEDAAQSTKPSSAKPPGKGNQKGRGKAAGSRARPGGPGSPAAKGQSRSRRRA